jgi:hypothetical protein
MMVSEGCEMKKRDEEETCHDGEVIVVDAVVVDGWLKQVRVCLEPGDG